MEQICLWNKLCELNVLLFTKLMSSSASKLASLGSFLFFYFLKMENKELKD